MTLALKERIRAAFEDGRFPFSLVGVALFGSWAAGTATPASDIDLLVVAEDIAPKRHRRGEDIVAVKKALRGLDVDVLLLTPSETRENFANHNPLFLDIAEDAVVVYDPDGFLDRLLEETRRYVRSHGITRLSGGWKFPVADRKATPLSRVSNRDFSRAMLLDGERDFAIGVLLKKNGFFDKAVYHFQPSAEKCVKSILIAFGVFQKSHYVGERLSAAVRDQESLHGWSDRLMNVAELSEKIEPDVSLSRYPGISNDALWLPSEEYDVEDAARSEGVAEQVLAEAKAFFDWWFQREGE